MRRLQESAGPQELRDAIRELQDEHFRRAEYSNGDSGTAKTLDFASRPNHSVTLSANVTFSATAPARPMDLRVRLVQDGTGGRTVTWFADVLWAGGTPPTVNTGAGTIHLIGFFWNGTSYYGYTLGLSYA